MAKNGEEKKGIRSSILDKYAKDAEAKHLAELEQMLKDAGIDIDALAEEGDDEED